RIERLTLEGIGPFDGATFEPLPPVGAGELVLFEGPNGSGKTTILEAIAVLIGSTSLHSESATAPPVGALLRRIRVQEPHITLELAQGSAAVLLAQEKQVQLRGHALWPRVVALENAAGTNTPTDWAAFAFRGAQPTANLATQGPKRLEREALRGALSF